MSANLSWKGELQTKLQLLNSKESSPIHYIFEQRGAGSFLLLKISHKLLNNWTSMVGNEKKKVLPSLPEKFPQILDPERCDTTTKIWKVFYLFVLQLIAITFSLAQWHHTEEP